MTLRVHPARGWTLRWVIGRTFRPPRPILSEVCCGQRYQTTERVVPETGDTYGFEATYVPNPRWRAGAFLARTDFDDHVLQLAGDSTFFVQTYALANVPEARAERAETTLRVSPLPWLQLDASATWLSFRNRGDPQVEVWVAPPSFDEPERRTVRIDRIPYLPARTASLGARVSLPGNATLNARAAYTGAMEIQQFTRLLLNSELDTQTLRSTPGFWLVNVTAAVSLGHQFDLVATIDNLTDRLQHDLGDPTTEFNWGPLAGRSARLALRFHPDR